MTSDLLSFTLSFHTQMLSIVSSLTNVSITCTLHLVCPVYPSCTTSRPLSQRSSHGTHSTSLTNTDDIIALAKDQSIHLILFFFFILYAYKYFKCAPKSSLLLGVVDDSISLTTVGLLCTVSNLSVPNGIPFCHQS